MLQGKEVATNISKLPEGTVVFEDVSTEKRRGKIAKVYIIILCVIIYTYITLVYNNTLMSVS